MQYKCIFPYSTCDLGLAMNISRPVVSEDNPIPTNVALGFHFDSINSSPATDNSNPFAQARGATGNFGNMYQTTKILIYMNNIFKKVFVANIYFASNVCRDYWYKGLQ